MSEDLKVPVKTA